MVFQDYNFVHNYVKCGNCHSRSALILRCRALGLAGIQRNCIPAIFVSTIAIRLWTQRYIELLEIKTWVLDYIFEVNCLGVPIIDPRSCHWFHWIYVSQDPNYCSQEKIFHDLGVCPTAPACNLICFNMTVWPLIDSMALHPSEPGAFVLKNAFEGYNCSVFAYGQVHVDILCGATCQYKLFDLHLSFTGGWRLPGELMVWMVA